MGQMLQTLSVCHPVINPYRSLYGRFSRLGIKGEGSERPKERCVTDK